MNAILLGESYIITVSTSICESSSLLVILAVCRDNSRCSSINNLNFIISELRLNPYDHLYFDSTWLLSARTAKRLFNKVCKLFSTPGFAKALERYLDDDRACGEWENMVDLPLK